MAMVIRVRFKRASKLYDFDPAGLDLHNGMHVVTETARGVELGKKEPLFTRLKNAAGILLPLILSSLARIDVISNAMELRGFGKGKKRTWYSGRKFSGMDLMCMIVSLLLVVLSLTLTYLNGGRYYNPFL